MSPVTSLAMRSENWATVSPSSARIGSPDVTNTGGRPRAGQFWPYGMASAAPTIATGRHGTSLLMHNAAAPGLKAPISPVLDRVPSGKSNSGTPSSSRPVASPWRPRSAG